jgi:hypothetical protein
MFELETNSLKPCQSSSTFLASTLVSTATFLLLIFLLKASVADLARFSESEALKSSFPSGEA